MHDIGMVGLHIEVGHEPGIIGRSKPPCVRFTDDVMVTGFRVRDDMDTTLAGDFDEPDRERVNASEKQVALRGLCDDDFHVRISGLSLLVSIP
jgi:hypothetical protein